ncbi:MAG: efflux RND transporter periplasmic adaptor subunit [Alphaproteobacteria bacterium]|nr:efflux RND transporter periplasmic adaptor subunit [Alphaproteobacteria bacterium]
MDKDILRKLKFLRIPEKQIEQLKKTKKDSVLVTIYAPQKGYIDSLNILEGM